MGALTDLKRYLNLADEWQRTYLTTINFSFYMAERSIQSRIDRIYINDSLGDGGGTIEILSWTCMFDHSRVMLVASESKHHISPSMCIQESIQVDE